MVDHGMAWNTTYSQPVLANPDTGEILNVDIAIVSYRKLMVWGFSFKMNISVLLEAKIQEIWGPCGKYFMDHRAAAKMDVLNFKTVVILILAVQVLILFI